MEELGTYTMEEESEWESMQNVHRELPITWDGSRYDANFHRDANNNSKYGTIATGSWTGLLQNRCREFSCLAVLAKRIIKFDRPAALLGIHVRSRTLREALRASTPTRGGFCGHGPDRAADSCFGSARDKSRGGHRGLKKLPVGQQSTSSF